MWGKLLWYLIASYQPDVPISGELTAASLLTAGDNLDIGQ